MTYTSVITGSSHDLPLPWNTRRPHLVSMDEDPLAGIKPRRYEIGGRVVHLYGIGALAHVLGRKSDTIRGWEAQGWLPEPIMIFSGRNPQSAASSRHGRRRLYTRELILDVYRIALEEGIVGKHPKPIRSTNFVARVREVFRRHAALAGAEAA